MKDNCPQCGKKYDEPQPDNFICADCAFMNALAVFGVKIIEKPKDEVKDE